MVSIHKRLYAYIDSNNISLEYISKVTGIDIKRLISVFKAEECDMCVDEYTAVCKALNIPFDFVI